MNRRIGAIVIAFAALCVAAPASSASVDSQFSAAIARVLEGVRNDFLDSMSKAEKRQFVACAQKVMSGAPLDRKQYVLAAKNTGEMRRRFDEVALDNRAALKQRITRECS